MEELKQLLSRLNANSSVNEIKSTFSKIANILLFKSYIKTENGNYRLLEIEFYFRNTQHDDEVTLIRTEDAGMWWLHDWGVDLSFKSEGRDFCGGILIRSIVPLNMEKEETVICGPRSCCWTLFYSSALDCNFAPQIMINSEGNEYLGEMGKTTRYIKGRVKRVDGEYRFYVKGFKPKFESKYDASPWEE